ncbi:hypothetical protein THITH_00270 [Thioalkalivibrio paradoxus ARh 1]|uniref:DUF4351 domain-containing protein n=1 Tax=Thioalkalivibrio paradoxus ARh 1 TaxID=713585 RepID=W0DF23_9GAMM|nr:DUF4351 domain-containing protein [Thioalkalivibrio paradoxus]AHE96961.1 hypothetical protein THITH_00270 [Thioalkalivibrio paradoxus ARh 1]
MNTQRVVPVVVFLHRGDFPTKLSLGGDAGTYLDFRFLAYAIPRIPAREHFESPNLVARLNLPNMAYAPEEKLEVYAQAMRGLTTLEPDPERRIKYLDFIDIYAAPDENERIVYRQRSPEEVAKMTRFAERFMDKGREEGIGQGEARMLLRLLTLKFGPLPEPVPTRIESADADTLLRWSERVLTADHLDEVFEA